MFIFHLVMKVNQIITECVRVTMKRDLLVSITARYWDFKNLNIIASNSVSLQELDCMQLS